MNKTIKVIDLLVKISNGEEVPKKIKVFNHIFKRELDADDVWYYLDGSLPLLSLINSTAVLNTEAEIIEEEPEIDIQALEETNELLALKSVDFRVSTEENLKRIDKAEIDMFYKLIEVTRKQNEILKAIKQLDKKLKKN